MPATIISGYRGNVDFGGAIADIKNWSISVTVDVHDITSMHATNVAKSKITGLTDWTATAEAVALEVGPTAAEGTAATLKLYLSDAATDGYFEGPAIVSGLSVTQSPGDAGMITYSFQGNGLLEWKVI